MFGKFIRGIYINRSERVKRDGSPVIDIAIAVGVDSYKLRCRDDVLDAAKQLKFGDPIECMISQWRSNDGSMVIDYADTINLIAADNG